MNTMITITILTIIANNIATPHYHTPASKELVHFLQKSFKTLFVPNGAIIEANILRNFILAARADDALSETEFAALIDAWRKLATGQEIQVLWTSK